MREGVKQDIASVKQRIILRVRVDLDRFVGVSGCLPVNASCNVVCTIVRLQNFHQLQVSFEGEFLSRQIDEISGRTTATTET